MHHISDIGESKMLKIFIYVLIRKNNAPFIIIK